MKRENNRKKGKYSFVFEEFIEVNGVNITELPDYIQTMISTITKERIDAKLKCTKPHYRIIMNRLQKFADIIEDYLMNHFDDRLSNNTIEEDEVEKEDKKTTKKESKSKAIIALADRFGRNYLLSSELKSLEVEVDYSEKEILIDELRLERELGTARWYLGINPNYKEVQS